VFSGLQVCRFVRCRLYDRGFVLSGSETEPEATPDVSNEAMVGKASVSSGLAPSEKPLVTLLPNADMTVNEHVNVAAMRPREVMLCVPDERPNSVVWTSSPVVLGYLPATRP
jgi:zona occludens toxin (predicted ATPase)